MKLQKDIKTIYFDTTFNLIFDLIEKKNVYINIPMFNIENLNGLLNKNKLGGFDLNIEFNEKLFECLRNDISFDIVLFVGKYTCNISNFYLTKTNNVDNVDYFYGEIHELKKDFNLENKVFCRFVIPVNNKNAQLFYFIEAKTYCDENMFYARSFLSFKMAHLSFNLYETKREDKRYFIIDSDEQIDVDEFADLCHSIMISYGFLSGDFIQDEAYYITSKDNDFNVIDGFSYLQLRPSIYSKGIYNPIFSNPYGYSNDDGIIKVVGDKLKVFDSFLFSKLCNLVHFDENYAIVILLIIEANVSSLILKPACYSVALERLTNILIKENKGLKPIIDKKISKNFIAKLKEVLDVFSQDIIELGGDNSIEILRKNIENINKPTNRNKLLEPFNLCDIELNSDEINAINHRNNFLHGRNINEGTEDYKEINQISFRLNKLINKLMLKHIGFSGYVVNHLKHNEKNLGIVVNEELFEKV
ncbi:hypothetical protein [Empedobacter sedimenti]|uniref:hypothetical protein n=1 Tax=Empedobacter sedimenti TaxID=3042610 RepID=UPI0024A73F63|nr:hypothetical protein [Empedobacter sedimenti]